MSQNDVDAIERMLGGKPASAPKPGKRPPRQYAAEVKDDSGVNDPNAKKQPSRRIFWPFPLMAKNQFFECNDPVGLFFIQTQSYLYCLVLLILKALE